MCQWYAADFLNGAALSAGASSAPVSNTPLDDDTGASSGAATGVPGACQAELIRCLGPYMPHDTARDALQRAAIEGAAIEVRYLPFDYRCDVLVRAPDRPARAGDQAIDLGGTSNLVGAPDVDGETTSDFALPAVFNDYFTTGNT